MMIKKVLVKGGFSLHRLSEKLRQFSVACALT